MFDQLVKGLKKSIGLSRAKSCGWPRTRSVASTSTKPSLVGSGSPNSGTAAAPVTPGKDDKWQSFGRLWAHLALSTGPRRRRCTPVMTVWHRCRSNMIRCPRMGAANGVCSGRCRECVPSTSLISR